ncbi:MAG: MATE family efflux transporter [Bacteroidota bacterium]
MNRRILNLAVPNIISNVTVPLLSMVDISLVGHLDVNSKLHIGAISLGTMLFNFIYWSFSFLRMGTSGFAAQAYGRGDYRETMLVLSRAVSVAIGGAIFLIVLQYPIAKVGFYLLNGSKEVEALAREYFFIRIWAAPATIGLYALTGWFIGMQNARIPMSIAITVNLLNIGFNYTLIHYFGMASDGVALGTVIAQYCGFILALYIFFKRHSDLLKYWSYKAMLELKALKLFFAVNRNIFIRTICLIFVMTFFTAQSADIGDTTLAVNSVLLQFFMFFSFVMDGFAYAAEALTGRFVGEQSKVKLTKTVKLLFLWGIGFSSLFTLVYIFLGDHILFLLTDNKEVLKGSEDFIYWVWGIPLITFTAFLWDGIFIGATASSSMRNAMLLSTLVFFIPVYYLLAGPMGNHGLWLAFLLFQLSRGVIQTFQSSRAIFNKLN